MISCNIQLNKNIEQNLKNEIDKIKNKLPNWILNKIVKIFSFGKIDLYQIKQKQINELIDEIEKIQKIYKKIDKLELELTNLENSIKDIYINDYKRRQYKTKLELMLKEYSFYNLSLENKKYKFLSKFFIDSLATVKEKNDFFVKNEKIKEADFF